MGNGSGLTLSEWFKTKQKGVVHFVNCTFFHLSKFVLLGYPITEVKKMYHDSNDKKNSAAIIPIQNMINDGGVIFFGEDSGFIDDPDYNEELRNENIRKLSR